MKYKPCCDTRCVVGGCKTREDGGCYCVCRLKDAESSRLSLLEGKEEQETLNELMNIKKLKEYEVVE